MHEHDFAVLPPSVLRDVDPRLAGEIFTILHASNVGIAVIDGDGKVVWGNPQYERISHLSIDEIRGRNILDVVSDEHISVMGDETMYAAVMRQGSPITRMVDFNTEHDVIATATPIFNDDGSLRWLMYSLTDWDQLASIKQTLLEMTERAEISQHQLQEALLGDLGRQGIIVRDKAMLDIYATALRLAHVSATLLILGETGTGKDHMAKFIHNAGTRKDKPFVHVNCSAIPENLFESELFGYESGSFTGAGKNGKMGLIEFADQGTLYLDEVAELPLNMQAKLLTVLQNRTLVRIGGVQPRPVDVRVIAATNMDLQALVQEKKFREDLYYRLNVLEIHIPALRERQADIIPFVHYFAEVFNKRYHQTKQFSRHALEILSRYAWPGNVRELEHLVERLIIMTQEDFIGAAHLTPELQNLGKEARLFHRGGSLKDILAEVEEMVLRDAIERSDTLQEAAHNLGIEISTLTKKKQKYNIYKIKK